MSPEERNLDFLKSTVKDIYEALKNTEKHMADQYDYIETILPDEIFFITSQELEDRYPDLTPKEREYTITKEKVLSLLCRSAACLLPESVRTDVPRTTTTGP